MATVVSGSIDFFGEKCKKHTIGAGDMYFENSNPQALSTMAPSIAYLIKQDAPRCLEQDAPVCASKTCCRVGHGPTGAAEIGER
jgi:hypothetical protein